MIERSCEPPDFMRSEVDRYLGWPGQAISYKVGERVWLESRADARRRHGANFDLRTGEALTLPAFTPVETYPVLVEDRVVKVELP